MIGFEDFIGKHRKLFTIITEQQFDQKYQEKELIGAGSYGIVMRAKTAQGQYVAIKQFKKEAARYLKQTIRQITNLKKLNQANIIKYYQCYLINETLIYLVTEYCPEGNLKNYIENELDQFRKMEICQQIAQGLAYAHQQNVIHRDLKPDNIFMGRGGVAKIGDFGCSTEIEEENQVMESRVGSLAYMDPQVRKGTYNKSVDVYSLGMVYVCIYNGKGIYDQCRNRAELDRQMSNLYRGYDTNMERYLQGVCQFMREIIKNCLMRDESTKFTASEIAKKIKAELRDNMGNTMSSKAFSTNDWCYDESYEDSRLFISEIIENYRRIEEDQRCEQTKKLIFQLLIKNEKNVNKLQNIQTLLFVKEATKAQYTFFVLFYYHFWLFQIDKIVKGQQTLLKDQYELIDSAIIKSETLKEIVDFIDEQNHKIKGCFAKCAKLVRSQLKLMENTAYMPENFKDIVDKASLGISIDYNKFENGHLLDEINSFFELRIKKQYYHNWDNNTLDTKLSIIESIGQCFI